MLSINPHVCGIQSSTLCAASSNVVFDFMSIKKKNLYVHVLSFDSSKARQKQKVEMREWIKRTNQRIWFCFFIEGNCVVRKFCKILFVVMIYWDLPDLSYDLVCYLRT